MPSNTTAPRKRRIAPVEARKEHVIDIAVGLFIEHGYEGVSMDEIVRRSGISKPTLYRWHGNKEGLFEACVISATRDAGVVLEELPSDPRPPDIVLKEAARRFFKLYLSTGQRELIRLMIGEARRFPRLIQEIYATTFLISTAPVEQYFRALAAKGLARITGNEAVLANVFIMIVNHGLRYLLIEPHNIEDDEKYIDNVVDLFLHGFLAPSGEG